MNFSVAVNISIPLLGEKGNLILGRKTASPKKSSSVISSRLLFPKKERFQSVDSIAREMTRKAMLSINKNKF